MTTIDNSTATYRRLRRIIGYLGVSLPIILFTASLIESYVPMQHSLSHYYYTSLREIFTGILCAVGLFLIRYKGHANEKWWRNDSMLTNIAGVMAFGVALVPTNPEFDYQKIYTLIHSTNCIWGWVHYGFAAGLFSIFALLSISVFTLGQRRDIQKKSIWDENHIYVACGITILVSIVCIVVADYIFPEWDYYTFLFEAISLFAFGISWLIKGRALGSEGVIGEKLYGETSNKRQVDGVAGSD